MEDLTPSERATVANALRVAATVYDADAEMLRCDGQPREEEQFKRQAQEARALADRFES